MLKVGLDIQGLHPSQKSGLGYYVDGLYTALRACRDPEIQVIGLEGKWKTDLSTVKRFWHDRIELAQLAQMQDVDILHQPAFSCPKSNRQKVVWTLHDLRPLVLKELMSIPSAAYWKKWLPYSARYADRIVCVSENTRHDAVKYFGLKAEDLSIIPDGISERVVQWQMSSSAKQAICRKFGVVGPFFSSVSTIQPIKNFPFLVDVFAALRNEYQLDHQLVIIGKKAWDYDNVVRRLHAHHFTEGREVIMTDYVCEDEKAALVQESEAMLFPSLYEGFGLPPVEAQALGTPVLCADNSSLPWVIGPRGALFCSATNVKTWVMAYDRLAQNRDHLVAAGKKNIERFLWDRIAQQWLDVYRTLVL